MSKELLSSFLNIKFGQLDPPLEVLEELAKKISQDPHMLPVALEELKQSTEEGLAVFAWQECQRRITFNLWLWSINSMVFAGTTTISCSCGLGAWKRVC